MLTFGAAVSTAPDHANALDEVIPAALGQLGGAPDLVVCFFTMEHADAATGIALSLSERTGTSAILGCTAQGVIGDGREVEGEPGLAVWMARLPGVSVRPFALRVLPLEDGVGIGGWPDLPEEDRASVLLLADPFTFPADSFLERLNPSSPACRCWAGWCRGPPRPGGTGCSAAPSCSTAGPSGSPWSARSTSGRWSARAAARWARRSRSPGARATSSTSWAAGRRSTGSARCWPASTSTSRSCCGGGGLQVGQVIDEHKASFDRGDFLVRGLLGADPETGSIAVADSVEVGQTLQFHVRDADAADEDLELLLVPVSRWRPRGVLLFSCNGRGRGFFGEPDHDAARVAAATDAAPMAGFFAQGELGPIGGRNFLHTFTASMAVFCEPRDPVLALDRAATEQPPAPETPEPV